MHEPEREGDDPSAARRCPAPNVFEGHVNDRRGDEGLDERRKPERIRREIVSRCDERDRVGNCEGGDDRNQCAEFPEGKHEAEEEKKMVRAVEDVEKAETHKAQRRLMPAGVEPYETRIARKLEGAHGAA